MKAGEYVRFALDAGDPSDPVQFRCDGTSTSEDWAKRDAASAVASGKSDLVYVVKIIAVARRSATLDE